MFNNCSKSITLSGFWVFILVSIFISLTTSTPIETKIVGGDLAQLGQFPYQAALLQSTLLKPVICGGSILSSDYVLIAAHCVFDQLPRDFLIRVGQIHLLNNLTEPYEQEAQVSKIIIHPQYSPSRFLNDIALIELTRPLVLDGVYVRNISLPVELQEEIAPGNDCVVAGWGAIKEGGAASRDLMYAHLPSMTDESCRKTYPNYIASSMFCAGFPAGGIDVCFGDSGGPLSCDDGKTVHGIISWGDGTCARPDTPSVHTQVSYFIEWIEQEMRRK